MVAHVKISSPTGFMEVTNKPLKLRISAAFTRNFYIVTKILKMTHSVFGSSVCHFEYFCGNGKSSCKCCWYFSCTRTVKNLYVTMNCWSYACKIQHSVFYHMHVWNSTSKSTTINISTMYFRFNKYILQASHINIYVVYTGLKQYNISWFVAVWYKKCRYTTDPRPIKKFQQTITLLCYNVYFIFKNIYHVRHFGSLLLCYPDTKPDNHNFHFCLGLHGCTCTICFVYFMSCPANKTQSLVQI